MQKKRGKKKQGGGIGPPVPTPPPLWTDTQSKNITFAVLCRRAVITMLMKIFTLGTFRSPSISYQMQHMFGLARKGEVTFQKKTPLYEQFFDSETWIYSSVKR